MQANEWISEWLLGGWIIPACGHISPAMNSPPCKNITEGALNIILVISITLRWLPILIDVIGYCQSPAWTVDSDSASIIPLTSSVTKHPTITEVQSYLIPGNQTKWYYIRDHICLSAPRLSSLLLLSWRCEVIVLLTSSWALVTPMILIHMTCGR